MSQYELWVNVNCWWGDRQTHRQTHTQTDRHINSMTRPGLGVGPSENNLEAQNPRRDTSIPSVSAGLHQQRQSIRALFHADPQLSPVQPNPLATQPHNFLTFSGHTLAAILQHLYTLYIIAHNSDHDID